MTNAAQIAWDDTVLPFQLDRTDIRGRITRLDSVLDQVLAQHNYPPLVEQLICEAAMLTALIGQTIKLRWKLSLQVRGDGPVRLIATDFFAPSDESRAGRIRAYAGFDADHLDHARDAFSQIGRGYFAILIDQGEGNVPYQGITPLAGGSLSACAQSYFAQSEQLPSRFHLHFRKSEDDGRWRGGGVMLQKMPAASIPPADGGENGILTARDMLDRDEHEDWRRTNLLLDTVQGDELIGPDLQATDVLFRLFHQEGPRIFDPLPVRFGCTCSEDRVRNSLSIYSAKDIRHMTTDDGIVTADCQFCGAHYELDPATVGFEAGNGPR